MARPLSPPPLSGKRIRVGFTRIRIRIRPSKKKRTRITPNKIHILFFSFDIILYYHSITTARKVEQRNWIWIRPYFKNPDPDATSFQKTGPDQNTLIRNLGSYSLLCCNINQLILKKNVYCRTVCLDYSMSKKFCRL